MLELGIYHSWGGSNIWRRNSDRRPQHDTGVSWPCVEAVGDNRWHRNNERRVEQSWKATRSMAATQQYRGRTAKSDVSWNLQGIRMRNVRVVLFEYVENRLRRDECPPHHTRCGTSRRNHRRRIRGSRMRENTRILSTSRTEHTRSCWEGLWLPRLLLNYFDTTSP